MDTVSFIQSMLVNLILTAQQNLDGEKGAVMAKWVEDRLLSQIESNDNLIPWLGQYADVKDVDKLEAASVHYGVQKGRELASLAVKKAYVWALGENLIPKTSGNTTAPVALDEQQKQVAEALGVDVDKLEETSGDETPEEEDTDELLKKYQTGGGWYTFPGEKGAEVHKEKGKDAARDYYNTRADLIEADKVKPEAN